MCLDNTKAPTTSQPSDKLIRSRGATGWRVRFRTERLLVQVQPRAPTMRSIPRAVLGNPSYGAGNGRLRVNKMGRSTGTCFALPTEWRDNTHPSAHLRCGIIAGRCAVNRHTTVGRVRVPRGPPSHEPVVQRTEREPSKLDVAGSSPARLTNRVWSHSRSNILRTK